MSVDPAAPAPSAYAYPLLIKQLLHTPRVQSPRQEIVYRDLARYDYATFFERIARLANALEALGIGQGDTVAVMDWDSNRYLEAYFAVPMLGAVLLTVNVRLSPEQVQYTLEHSATRAILANTDFLPLLGEIAPRLAAVRRFVRISDPDAAPVIAPDAVRFDAEYEAMLAAASPVREFADFDEGTRATTFYTTGTTGLPKGVHFSHRQIVLHTITLAAALAIPQSQGRLHRADVYMPITPMFHVHAWGIPYIATMLGLKQVYPGRYTPEILVRLLREERVTFSHCVPTILHMILNCQEGKDLDLKGWKMVIGGSALPLALAQAALARGIDVLSGYGMSETAPVLTLAQVKPGLEDGDNVDIRRCAGLPVPLVDLRVVDADMRDVPHDGVSAGEVVARTPWLTQGYFGNPEASEALWAGGYLHTGDIGTMDAEGYLRITDRIKDVVKTGGEWVSSLQIEDLIARHEGVSEVAVVGVPDARWGERPLALVVRRPAHADTLDAEAIRAHVRRYAEEGVISKFAVPDRVVFVDAIPKTSVGKLDKKAMRAQYG